MRIQETNNESYQREKAKKALKKAKALEAERIKNGYRWKTIPGTTTEVLSPHEGYRI